MGISLGGAVCLGMLAASDDNFHSAILINTFSKIRPEKFSHLLYMFTRFYKVSFLPMREQAEYMAKKLFPTERDAQFRKMIVDQIMTTDRRIYRQTILALGRLNLDQKIRKIHTECLVLTGMEDSTIPPVLQVSLSEKLKNSTQIFIANAGHAVIVQEPEQVNQAVIQYLTRSPHNL
jgi:pimeloyl-ACP methyl ester carboxylesterase